MAPSTIAVRCPKCSRPFSVPMRADKTYPATVRCQVSRGGCGAAVKIPKAALTGQPARTPAATTAAAEWIPPSEPRGFRDTGWRCGDCHEAVRTEPRGTALWCSGCGSVLTPPAVLAPYQRGSDVTRAAKSQRERDLEAIALAQRKGVMAAQLAQLADDERLHPESRPVVEWFAEQVKTAATGTRLDELVALLPEADIRRRHFWQSTPALPAGYEDEDDDEGQDDAPVIIPRAIEAPPADTKPRRMTWGEVLAVNGYRLAPGGPGTCHLIGQDGRQCGQASARHIGDGWLCDPHYAALAGQINRDYQRRTA